MPKHLSLAIILIVKTDTPKVDVVFVSSVFLSFCCSKATVFAFSGQRPAVKAPYHLWSMFQSLSLCSSDRQTDFFVCDCSVLETEQESLISNELTSCNQYRHEQLNWPS